MQFIAGQSFKGFSPRVQSSLLPWEGWDGLQSTAKNGEDLTNLGFADRKDTSSSFTSTLVALKSSQLAATISPGTEITPDDLVDLDTAVSCFLKLCGSASPGSHIDALLSILGEREGLFLIGKDEEPSVEATVAGNDWGNDNWDEGWESLQEVEPPKKEMISRSFTCLLDGSFQETNNAVQATDSGWPVLVKI